MSGGVDSSVAAVLLKEEGYDVAGIHLKCFNVDGCAKNDAEDARRAAEHLGIPFYAFDFEKEYKDKVVKYMVAGYKKGITPNPDVMCNKEIKFGLFYEKAMELGADYIATGHYVRRLAFSVKRLGGSKTLNANRYTLAVAKDKGKDQSYFLWTLKPEQLEKCLFPIGEYTKLQVRKLAVKFGLHNAMKKDSQGICFLGQVALPEFLKKYIKPKKGDVLLMPALRGQRACPPMPWRRRGNLISKPIKVGEHDGAHFFTIGQRSGIGIGGFEKPLYVAAKDMRKNTVTVAEGNDHPSLYKKEIKLTDVNFQAPITDYQLPITVSARVRYRQPLQNAKLVISKWKKENGKPVTSYKLLFTVPAKFVASGQSAVFYRARRGLGGGGRQFEMLGGGVIS